MPGWLPYRRTTLFLLLGVTVLTGIAIAGLHAPPPGYWCFLLLPVTAAAIGLRQAWLCIAVLCCFGCLLGWQHGGRYQSLLDAYQPLESQRLTVFVVAASDAGYGFRSQLSFVGGSVSTAAGEHLPGSLQVSGFGVNSVLQGDEVAVTGKLRPGFGSYQGAMSYASLRVIRHHPQLLATLRRHFTAGMQTALPEPLASFAMGLLVGQRSTLPADIKQILLMVGLTHIIAVSGYNLTIMVRASQRLAGKRSKRIATGLTLGLVLAFLALAGSSASINRAVIISMLSILTGYYGRRIRALNLICYAAVITAWVNPNYLWHDAGWWLSFLAFFGILVVAPLVIDRLPQRRRRNIALLFVIETLCAELMTIPYILHTFGQISLVGLPANVLVATVIPLAMLLSFVTGLAGMLAGAVAGWVAWPAKFLLTYMLDVSRMLAHLPHIFQQQLGFSLPQTLLSYGLIVIVCLLLWHKTKRPKVAIITDNANHQAEELAT